MGCWGGKGGNTPVCMAGLELRGRNSAKWGWRSKELTHTRPTLLFLGTTPCLVVIGINTKYPKIIRSFIYENYVLHLSTIQNSCSQLNPLKCTEMVGGIQDPDSATLNSAAVETQMNKLSSFIFVPLMLMRLSLGARMVTYMSCSKNMHFKLRRTKNKLTGKYRFLFPPSSRAVRCVAHITQQ